MGTLTATTSPELAGSPVSFTATATVGAAATMVKSSGDGLSGEVNTTLATPHEVLIRDANGNPVPGVSVAWAAATGGGSVSPGVSTTNALGRATTTRTLGVTPGTQTTTATAALSGGSTTVTFTVTATVGGPTQMTISAGQNQVDTVGQTLPSALAVRVADQFNNPVSGVAINWAVIDGGGSVTPASSTTDASGIATTSWTLGTIRTPTDSIQLVQATGVADFDRAMADAKKSGAAGIIHPLDGGTSVHRRAFVQSALQHRLPGIYWSDSYVEDGGLMTYSVNIPAQLKRAASYVDRILHGAKPADLGEQRFDGAHLNFVEGQDHVVHLPSGRLVGRATGHRFDEDPDRELGSSLHRPRRTPSDTKLSMAYLPGLDQVVGDPDGELHRDSEAETFSPGLGHHHRGGDADQTAGRADQRPAAGARAAGCPGRRHHRVPPRPQLNGTQ